MKIMKQKGQVAIIAVIATVLIGLVGLIGYFIFYNPARSDNPTPTPTSTSQVSPTPMETPSETIPQSWRTYSSQEIGFSIRYPDDMEFNIDTTQRGAITLRHLGPTQREGTEVYDGIILTFNSQSLNGRSILEYAEAENEQIANEPVTDEVEEIGPITIAGMQGYQFETTSLGTFTHIYLPKGENEVLHIIKLVEDPEDQGFEQTVDQVLSSIEYLE